MIHDCSVAQEVVTIVAVSGMHGVAGGGGGAGAGEGAGGDIGSGVGGGGYVQVLHVTGQDEICPYVVL